MTAGRNDPCPCGSGKKYKKCHGMLALASAVSTPEAARAHALKALDVEVAGRLTRFAQARFGARWMSSATSLYLDAAGGEARELELELAIPGVLYFLPLSAGARTLADLWREDQGPRLSSDTRLLLDAYGASWLSIWEVTEVETGVGSTVTDVLTRQQRFVHDVRSSKSLAPYDVLLAIVLECDGVCFFGGAHRQPLPPREGEAVARDARRMCRVRTRPVPVATLRDPAMQGNLIVRWRREVHRLLTRPMPVVTNTDGDPLLPTTDDFEMIAPRAEVIERLRSVPGGEEPEREGDDMVVVITKAGNARHVQWDNTVIGRIVATPRRLRIETNSTRRAGTLRAAVEAHLGAMVRFRLRQESSLSGLLESARAGAPGRTSPDRHAPPRETLDAVRTFREQHMTAWLDDSIPALDGLTPRHAATLPGMRRRLDALLKDFEQHETRLPREERIDIGRLRVALGLVTG